MLFLSRCSNFSGHSVFYCGS